MTQDAPSEIVVVGASLAGLNAVQTLRKKGFQGKLTLVGAEKHLPYDRPPLSKELLTGIFEPADTELVSQPALDKLELNLRLGTRALSLDTESRTVELDSGDSLSYDALLIATGATPRRLPNTPDLPGIHTLRTLDDAVAIKERFEANPRVVVVGAGFIGSEVAASARGHGLEVTIVEALEIPLVAAVGPEMGRACMQLHLDNGVEVRTGTGVAGFEGEGRVERVVLADGSTIDADLVVVGIGVVPETGWLQSSGLELDNGIVCDEYCRTSAPGVYAAGDIASWHNPTFDQRMRVEHWSNAVEQGSHAAANMLAGEAATPFAPVPDFWSDQYTTKIQFLGRYQPGDEVEVVRGAIGEPKLIALYRRGDRLVGALAFSEPRRLIAYHSLIENRTSWDEAIAFAREQS